MFDRISKLWPSLGRILFGALLAVIGGARVAQGLISGHASFFSFQTGFSDHPVYFIGIVTLFAAVLAGGVLHIADGVAGLRSGKTAAKLPA